MEPSAAADVGAFLREAGIAGTETLICEPLPGGVSSDIYKVTVGAHTLCVKRALPRLKVKARWSAPVERNAYEVGWMRAAHARVPGCVPQVIAHDEARGMFAMAYLPPGSHTLWKAALREGCADPDFAARVGESLGRIHAGTAADPQVAAAFATDGIFHDIRLEPYLLATARAHPALAARLRLLARATAANHRALVHGDVSPKNILMAPDGSPVFLDAECAWYGDPAFDVAFCLNHLLLKCLWTPAAREGFLACFEALARTHLACVDWESPGALQRRIAALIPGLLLARVDGKSPVEYITTQEQRALVRTTARELLMRPACAPEEVAGVWRQRLEAAGAE